MLLIPWLDPIATTSYVDVVMVRELDSLRILGNELRPFPGRDPPRRPAQTDQRSPKPETAPKNALITECLRK